MAEKEMTKRQARVVKRLNRRANRRDLICLEARAVRANDGSYALLSGRAKAQMRMLAEAHEIQRARIAKKRETRQRLAAMTPKQRREAREAGQKQFHKGLTV